MGTKRAIIYVRISQDQLGERIGVRNQIEACRALCTARGYTVVGDPYEDNSRSAFTGAPRPEFDRALADIAAGEADVLVAYAVDRVTRNMRDLMRLIEARVQVVTAQGDIDHTKPMGETIAIILAAIAQMEVKQKAVRQRLANVAKARAGGRTKGVRPFGYTDDQTAIVLEEAGAIRQAAKAVLAGTSLAAIARQWNEDGFATTQRRTDPETGEKAPTAWSPSGVRYILTSPRYVGRRVYTPKPEDGESPEDAAKRAVVTPATWPAILDEETFDRVAEVLTRRGVDYRPDALIAAGMKPQNLLSGIAVCSCHGAPVRATSRKGPLVNGEKTTRKVYACPDRALIMERALPDAWVEEVLLSRMEQALSRMEQADAVDVLGEDAGGELEELRTEKVDLQKRLDALTVRFMEGKLTEDQFDTANDTAGARRRVVQGRLAALGRTTTLGSLIGAPDVRAAWAELGIDQRRLVLGELVDRVELRTDRRGLVAFAGYPTSIDLRWRPLR